MNNNDVTFNVNALSISITFTEILIKDLLKTKM
jgi:hypothetical protein